MGGELTKFEISAISYAVLSLLSYHIFLYSMIIFYRKTSKAQLARMIENSTLWMAKHKEKADPQSVTLAIHTLRNTILVAIFVGGNVVSFGLNLTNSFVTIPLADKKLRIRSIMMAIFLICSFLCWVCVIRFASQLGYYVGTLGVQRDHLIRNVSQEIFTPSRGLKFASTPTRNNNSNSSAGATATHTPRNLATNQEEKDQLLPPGVNVSSYQLTIVDIESLKPPSLLSPSEDTFAELTQEDYANLEKRQLKECTKILILCSICFSLGFRFLFLALPFAFYSMGSTALIISSSLLIVFLFFYDFGTNLLLNLFE